MWRQGEPALVCYTDLDLLLHVPSTSSHGCRFAYSSVERTVCPLQNGDSEELSVHVTSSSPSPLTLFINTSLVEGYSLQ